MDHYLVWLIAAFSLVIIELLTGTFYLLVLGISAFAGAAVAGAELSFLWQAVSASVIALAGCVWVHHWHRRQAGAGASAFSVDSGQPAVFESWISRDSRHARVRYRDALWDAVVRDADPQPGEVLYVVSVHGNTLEISKTRPV
jgi:membrane protein implicated in regulation of membrane protease activity